MDARCHSTHIGFNMTKQDDGAQVPPGFERLQRGGPYVAALGPLYCRRDGDDIVIAMRIEQRHTNMRGIAHGGMLASLADCALSMGIAISCNDKQSFVTVNLTTDFVEAARPGDWVEGRLDIQKITQRFAFANCYLQVGDKRILRASGVFAVMKPLTAAQLKAG
jgi:uncharacterized protein (TIGR00369 family)